MEIYERIRVLRKKHLNMTMDDFGERLGVSRNVIKNIELNRLAKPEQKLPLIKLISKEFDVNEDWILKGIEPIFVDPNTFSLDKFLKDRGASELEQKAVRAYFELEPEFRQKLVEHFKQRLAKPKEPEMPLEELTFMTAAHDDQRTPIQKEVLTEEQLKILREAPEIESLDDFQNKNKDE